MHIIYTWERENNLCIYLLIIRVCTYVRTYVCCKCKRWQRGAEAHGHGTSVRNTCVGMGHCAAHGGYAALMLPGKARIAGNFQKGPAKTVWTDHVRFMFFQIGIFRDRV